MSFDSIAKLPLAPPGVSHFIFRSFVSSLLRILDRSEASHETQYITRVPLEGLKEGGAVCVVVWDYHPS